MENWKKKKKRRRLSTEELMLSLVLKKTLESPLDYKEIKLVNPKQIQPWIFIERTDAEAEASILWPPDMKNWLTGKDLDVGKDWVQEEKGQGNRGIRKLDSITTSVDIVLIKLWEAVKDREVWCAAVNRVAKNQTWLNDWKTTTFMSQPQ